MSQIWTIITAAIVIIIMAIGGYMYINKLESEKAALIRDNATMQANVVRLKEAVALNEKTIVELQEQAKRVAEANINLSSQIAESERLLALEQDRVLNQELSNVTDTKELEKMINEQYAIGNRNIERDTGGSPAN